MTGKIIGYIRVSSELQNTDRQLEGIKTDKTFTDKLSGKNTDRPALNQMLEYARDGDTVIVHSMDRLARNLDNLRKIVKQLNAKQVKVRFIKEALEFTGDDSAMSNLLLSVMGAFAEFERNLIKERQMEGVALAKKRGAYKGRKKALTIEQQTSLLEAAKNGASKTELANYFDINRSTVYEYINGKNGLVVRQLY
jgi:DNA invertase Pin-like site-specific DNA recombinase